MDIVDTHASVYNMQAFLKSGGRGAQKQASLKVLKSWKVGALALEPNRSLRLWSREQSRVKAVHRMGGVYGGKDL